MKNNLSTRRKALHLTQAQVAQAVHIHENAYRRYECGSVEPSVRMALRIANALNTTVEDLFPLENQEG